MKEHFDEELANKIRDAILDHVEVYEEGAWERFLNRKENNKNRVPYWYFTGIASSVLLVVSIGWILLKNFQRPIDIQNPLTIKERPLPHPRLMDSTSARDNEDYNQYFLKDISKKNNTYVSSSDDTLNLHRTTRNKLTQKDGRHKDTFKKVGKDRSVMAVTQSIMLFGNALPNDAGDINFLALPIENIYLNSEQLTSYSTEENYKVPKSDKKNIEVGLQISPSYGSNNASSQALTSTNFGGGVILNVPIKSSAFSINTGIIFNDLRLTNEESMLASSEVSMEEDKHFKEETRLYNLDIPLNLMYKIPSKRNYIYVQAGMSSYLTFNENMASIKTTFREVEVFQDVDGTTHSYMVTEAISSKEELDYHGTKLIPLGSLNLSLGYKAPLTDRIKYEIQPFYKFPLNPITTENTKVSMGGISLKVSITP